MAKVTRKQVLTAIEGSGGIILQIARKLNIDWHTAEKYIQTWESTRQAYRNEKEKILDLSESVVIQDIKNEVVGTAKWYLTRKGKERGYAERRELTGEDGEPIQITGINIIKPDDEPDPD